ncbi:MAG: lysozyme [Chloroflexi bacterium]|nr:lysozyme [Chloroflexota bacterium]
MTRARLERALWLRRERFRYARWRSFVKTKPPGNVLRAKWYELYHEALYERVRCDAQLRRVTGVSRAGVELVKRFEGFRGAPYRDAVGVWTIGYGETRGITSRSHHVTQQEAATMLRRRLDRDYFSAVKALPTFRSLTQNQVDALTSFAYNLGGGILQRGHTMGDALRAGNMKQAADAFLLYDKAGGRTLSGLTRRRHAERELFSR